MRLTQGTFSFLPDLTDAQILSHVVAVVVCAGDITGAFGAQVYLERLGVRIDAFHVHVGAPAVLALRALERHERVDAVGAHELAVAQGNHARVTLGHGVL